MTNSIRHTQCILPNNPNRIPARHSKGTTEKEVISGFSGMRRHVTSHLPSHKADSKRTHRENCNTTTVSKTRSFSILPVCHLQKGLPLYYHRNNKITGLPYDHTSRGLRKLITSKKRYKNIIIGNRTSQRYSMF